MNNDKKGITTENGVYEKATKTKYAKKKGKFNVVDAILIIVVLAAVASLVAYFLPGITSYFTREEEYTITYKIEIRGVDGDIDISNIGSDMLVYDVINNYEIGSTKGEVGVEPYKVLVNSGELMEGSENEYEGKYVDHPQLKNIVITVEGRGVYSSESESFMINGQRIAVGKEFNIRIGGFTGVGYCIGMEFAEYN